VLRPILASTLALVGGRLFFQVLALPLRPVDLLDHGVADSIVQ
jgi:hypothetical protein